MLYSVLSFFLNLFDKFQHNFLFNLSQILGGFFISYKSVTAYFLWNLYILRLFLGIIQSKYLNLREIAQYFRPKSALCKVGVPHKELIHLSRGGSAIGDCTHHKGLSLVHIPGGKDLRHRGNVGIREGGNVRPPV